jgi:hypothetical protein
MKTSYSQIFNYAKGWYQKGDLMEDLAKICGHRNGIDWKHYHQGSILENLVYACHECKLLPNTDYWFLDFIKWSFYYSDLDNENKININREKITTEGLIRSLLSIIRHSIVRDGKETTFNILIEIEKPDPNILPLVEK